MKQHTNRFLASVLALALLLSMTACSGGNTTASSMRLRRAQGTVTVSDGGGKDVPVLDDLGLYSGYGVGTRTASYAWIDLDDVKLTKMDQNSEISIQKEGKSLDIEVISGSLFFNVTQPLADDETMYIHASTMLVGIRGTSGWVSCKDELSQVYILEGKVECSAGEQTVQVNAWQMAELTPDGELTVQEFDKGDLPAFVREEVDDGPEPMEPTPTPEPTPASDPDFEIVDGVLVKYNGPGGAVTIPSSVTSIGDWAFNGCYSLTSITIPGRVTRIGDWAFTGCTGLTDVYYGGSEEQWARIEILERGNEELIYSTIHYNS